MVTKENILDAIELMYVGFLYILFLTPLLVMVSSPLGSVPIYGEFSISAITLLTFSGSTLFLFYYYKHVWVLPRILCSLSLPVLGISFHELTWHIGCWITWGTGIPQFWAGYTILIFICTLALNKKYCIIELSEMRIYLILICLTIYYTLWTLVIELEFYQKLLSYEKGFGPNPHGLLVYGTASIGRLVWLLLVSKPGEIKNV